MSIGYFIGRGDKTECGGQVLEGDESFSLYGLIHSLEGHSVSCGKDGQTYQICGGVSYFTNRGRRVAGTLDSVSGCPCRAQLIPSVLTAKYGHQVSPTPQAARPAARTAPPATASALCDERFQLIDHQRQPLGPLKYALLQGSQCLAVGSLDPRGHSARQSSATPLTLSIATSAPSPVLE